MLVVFNISMLATVEALLVSVPESIGLMAFGVGLVVIAVLIRSFLTRGEKGETDKESLTE